MMNDLLLSQLAALAQVLVIDLMLAGDNAVVIGMAVTGLSAVQRRWAVLFGVGFAVVIRVAMAFVALRLLAIIGLTLAGGLLLLWVCWKMFRELRRRPAEGSHAPPPRKTLAQAMVQI